MEGRMVHEQRVMPLAPWTRRPSSAAWARSIRICALAATVACLQWPSCWKSPGVLPACLATPSKSGPPILQPSLAGQVEWRVRRNAEKEDTIPKSEVAAPENEAAAPEKEAAAPSTVPEMEGAASGRGPRLNPEQLARLQKEASVTDDFFRSVANFFSPKPPEPDPEEVKLAQKRRDSLLELEKRLRPLKLSVNTGTDDDGQTVRRTAPIPVLQTRADQSMVIYVAVNEEVITDVLLAMRIASKEFSERNLLVVPALVDTKSREIVELSPQLMASKLMQQQAVALPAAKNEQERYAWGAPLAAEYAEAVDQGMEKFAQDSGLALLVRRSGEVVRRAVGRPEWQKIFTELDL